MSGIGFRVGSAVGPLEDGRNMCYFGTVGGYYLAAASFESGSYEVYSCGKGTKSWEFLGETQGPELPEWNTASESIVMSWAFSLRNSVVENLGKELSFGSLRLMKDAERSEIVKGKEIEKAKKTLEKTRQELEERGEEIEGSISFYNPRNGRGG